MSSSNGHLLFLFLFSKSVEKCWTETTNSLKAYGPKDLTQNDAHSEPEWTRIIIFFLRWSNKNNFVPCIFMMGLTQQYHRNVRKRSGLFATFTTVNIAMFEWDFWSSSSFYWNCCIVFLCVLYEFISLGQRSRKNNFKQNSGFQTKTV